MEEAPIVGTKTQRNTINRKNKYINVKRTRKLTNKNKEIIVKCNCQNGIIRSS